MDNLPISSLSDAQAVSSHEYIWCATLTDGTRVAEQPGVSSDHLPADRVQRIEYLSRPNSALPRLCCDIRVEAGERFRRYWTTLWRPQGHGTQFLYVFGVERPSPTGGGQQCALMAFYPASHAIVFSHQYPFNAPWSPESPVCLLPADGKLTVEHEQTGWLYDGFGGEIARGPDFINFRAIP